MTIYEMMQACVRKKGEWEFSQIIVHACPGCIARRCFLDSYEIEICSEGLNLVRYTLTCSNCRERFGGQIHMTDNELRGEKKMAKVGALKEIMHEVASGKEMLPAKTKLHCEKCKGTKNFWLMSFELIRGESVAIKFQASCCQCGKEAVRNMPANFVFTAKELSIMQKCGMREFKPGKESIAKIISTVPEVNITVVPGSGKAESTDSKEWFSEMIDECKTIITESVFQSRWLLVEGYWMLGERILQERDNWAREEIYGQKIVQRVARSLCVSPRTVYYAMQCAKKFPSLDSIPDGKNISWRKLIQEHLPEPKTREEADDNLEANLNASLIEFLLEDKGKGVPVKLYRDEYGEVRIKKIIKGKEFRSVPIKDDIKKESTEKKVAKIPAGYAVEDSVRHEEPEEDDESG